MTSTEAFAHVAAPPNARESSLAPRIALAAATIGVGLWAGLFYSYQISVIRGLAEVDDVAYVTTFQAINDKIMNPWLGIILFGPPPLIAGAWFLNRRSAGPAKVLIGAGLVLNLASIAITGAGNVPLNDEIAEADATTPAAAAAARDDFEEPWNRLNLARTITSVASFVALSAATALSSTQARREES